MSAIKKNTINSTVVGSECLLTVNANTWLQCSFNTTHPWFSRDITNLEGKNIYMKSPLMWWSAKCHSEEARWSHHGYCPVSPGRIPVLPSWVSSSFAGNRVPYRRMRMEEPNPTQWSKSVSGLAVLCKELLSSLNTWVYINWVLILPLILSTFLKILG